jgi:hypothetical protein
MPMFPSVPMDVLEQVGHPTLKVWWEIISESHTLKSSRGQTMNGKYRTLPDRMIKVIADRIAEFPELRFEQ